MSEYIKREQVLKLLESAQAWGWSMNTLYDEIQALPAADVAPVVHGEWVLDAKNHAYCSQCLYGRNIETQIGWNYCPNCGSKMILEDD